MIPKRRVALAMHGKEKATERVQVRRSIEDLIERVLGSHIVERALYVCIEPPVECWELPERFSGYEQITKNGKYQRVALPSGPVKEIVRPSPPSFQSP
jgi:hypothetical protein